MITQEPIVVNSSVQIKRGQIVSIFGIVLIVIGFLTFGFGVSIYGALRTKEQVINQHGTSVFTSLWIMTTGILGVCMRCKSKNQCLVGTFNAFVITASILAFGAAATSIVGLVNYAECEERTYYDFTYFPKRLCRKGHEYGVAVYALLMVLHLLEMAISITVAVYGFKIYNCCLDKPEQQTHIQTFQLAPNPTILQNYMVPQPQFHTYQPPQNQTVVTSMSGQQFMLLPITSMPQPLPQQTTLISPVPTPIPKGDAFPQDNT